MKAYERLRNLPVFRGGLFARHAPARRPSANASLYPIWAVLAERVRRSGVDSVVEIGCGSGQLAGLWRDLGIKGYLGLDNNSARLAQARAGCPGYRFELIRPRTRVIGTVTSGDEPDRVRQFTTSGQVLEHYSQVLRELHVEPIHLLHGRTAFLFEGIK
jgi:SAM-dependent methyltransferase